jgi:serine/threonine protein kinase
MNLHANAWHVQNNILITQDGQSCLADFGFAATFSLKLRSYKLETLRFAAPECFSRDLPRNFHPFNSSYLCDPSKEGDIYSVAMTSFKVRSSALNHAAT